MRKTKWSLKMYKLQLLSTEGTLFGGPAGVKLLKLVEQAIENDYRRKRFDFRDPETNEKYTRKYSIVPKAGEIMISVGRYTTPDDYAQICIQVSDRVEFPYLALLDYKPAFKDARTLLKVVKRAFNKILVEKGVKMDLEPWDMGYDEALNMIARNCYESFLYAKHQDTLNPFLGMGFEELAPACKKLLEQKTKKVKKIKKLKIESVKKYRDYIIATDVDAVMQILHKFTDGKLSSQAVMMGQRALIKLKMLNEPIPYQVFVDEFGSGKGRDSTSYCTYRGAKYKKYDNDIDFLNLCRQLEKFALIA
ncbi:hypothetical protein [Prevotella sp. RM4]|uniref:hypothetical protein n=1 Tax=Prevotella sp. RM4 TaxID=1200547 RepID=UPI00051AADF4|nr:hypothetical protein [Prevotella sp. RM4]